MTLFFDFKHPKKVEHMRLDSINENCVLECFAVIYVSTDRSADVVYKLILNTSLLTVHALRIKCPSKLEV